MGVGTFVLFTQTSSYTIYWSPFQPAGENFVIFDLKYKQTTIQSPSPPGLVRTETGFLAGEEQGSDLTCCVKLESGQKLTSLVPHLQNKTPEHLHLLNSF